MIGMFLLHVLGDLQTVSAQNIAKDVDAIAAMTSHDAVADFAANRLKSYGFLPAGEMGGFSQKSNVIGVLFGDDAGLSSQFVVVGANRAAKDAYSIAGLLEFARVVSQKQKSKRTVLIALFDGAQGADEWAKNPTILPDGIDFTLNFGSIGDAKQIRVFGVKSSPDWSGLFSPLKSSLNLSIADAISPDKLGSGAAAAGYPSLYFDSPGAGKPTPEGAALAVDYALQLLKETERNRTLLSNGKKRAAPAAVIGGGDSASGRRVRLGTIPNYNDSGPGVLLDGVSEGSPAARAGLLSGDRILEWNGRKIDGVEDYSEVLTTALPFVQATLKVSRSGKELTLKIFPEPI